ncbi:hypothetical protein OIDMADRAFT_60717 [Oidiodendron maius Zn]|uniref:Uncharacterized protein n=1 Tax=Oidiodendron maius (strain Zn) TaxID=913774 RepID=A0A0C3GSU8_OIDMZ|nr:hypothetical protein OIDMADRAFT_60717 [Oidiodendron maius Zn]
MPQTSIPMALVTRPQRGHSPRHHQERPDPLEYLTPEDRLLNKGSSPFKASYYIPIVICIVHLDISLLSACQQANAYKENSNFSPNELSFIESRIPSVEVSEFFKSHSSFRSDIELKEAIEAYVDGLSKEKLLERLRSQGTIPFWTKMVIQYVNFGILTLDRTKIARADGNEVEVHENEFRRAVQELEAVYKCSLEFRDAIRVAAAKSEVDETSLGILKKRMDALNENFILMKRTLSGKLVGKPDETLMYPGDKWWQPPEPGPEFKDKDPKNVVDAFAPTWVQTTLTFLVPAISLLSCIPAALSFISATNEIGTARDADFFQLISSSAMAVLGLLTMMIPTFSSKTKLGKMAWFWTWILAGYSGVCAIVSIPLYLVIPTQWSAAVAFSGSVAQGLVTLQLMYAIEG